MNLTMNLSQTDFINLSESYISSIVYTGSESKFTNGVIPSSKVSVCNWLCNQQYHSDTYSRNNEKSNSSSSKARSSGMPEEWNEYLYKHKSHEKCHYCGSKFKKRRIDWSIVLSCGHKRQFKSASSNVYIKNCNEWYKTFSTQIKTSRSYFMKSFTTFDMSLKNFRARSEPIEKIPKSFSNNEPRFRGSNLNSVETLLHNSKKISNKSISILSSKSTSDFKHGSYEYSNPWKTQRNQFVGNNFYAMNLQIRHRRHKLEPYECEPGVCIPGQCNLIECEKRIRNRSMKSSATVTTKSNKLKAMSSETGRGNFTSESQNYNFKERKAPEPQYLPSSLVLPKSGKQGIRIGSTFSFNVDFSKDRFVDKNSGGSRVKSKYSTGSSKIPRSSTGTSRKGPKSFSTGTSLDGKQFKSKGTRGHRVTNQSGGSQSNLEMRHKGSLISQKHKRCFCTLQLRGQEAHIKGITLNTKKVQAKRVITFKTIGQNTKNIKPTKRNKIKYDVTDLDAHECEPGVCVPGKCNPYECLKRIEARHKRLHSKGVGIEVKSEPSPKLTVVTISGNAITESTSLLYDRLKNQDTALVMVGGADLECKISEGSAAQQEINKYSDRETETSRSYPKYKCAKTCTYCKLFSNESGFLDTAKFTERISQTDDSKLLSNESGFLDATKYTERVSQTNNKQKRKKIKLNLEPYECEPGVCVPGQCDPYICAERIKKRSGQVNATSETGKLHSKGIKTDKKLRSASASSMTSHKRNKIERTRHKQKRSHSQKFRPVEKTESIGRLNADNIHSPNRQAVRISSSFRFNIEFYKNKSLGDGFDSIQQLYKTKTLEKTRTRTGTTQSNRHKVKKSNKPIQDYSRVNRNQNNQANKASSKHESTDTGSLLKRCFCTAKLHSKKQNFKKKNKNKKIKQGQFKDVEPETSENLSVVAISGNAISSSTTLLYDHIKKRDTALMVIGGTDLECKISDGDDAHNALNKYSDRETDTSKSNPKYKCAQTCTYCKSLNDKSKFLEAIKYTERISQTDTKQRRKKHKYHLEPYECEPGFCVPGQCGPYICAERIRKRPDYANKISHTDKGNLKSKNTKPMSSKTSNSQASRQSYAKSRKRDTKSARVEPKFSNLQAVRENFAKSRKRDTTSAKIEPTKQLKNTPDRNVVRIGSKFSFNIEFYKEKKAPGVGDVLISREQKKMKTKEQYSKVPRFDSIAQVDLAKKRYSSPSQVNVAKKRHNSPSQANVEKRHKGAGIQPMLKRCFCTLALQKQRRKQKPLKQTSRGTDTPNYTVTPKFKDGYTKTKPYQLKPYECEPGICVPRECNPYECDKVIKKRLLKDAATDGGKYKDGVNRKLQFDKPMASKMSYAGILMKRCFCTLKLQNSHKHKHRESKDYSVQTRLNSPSVVASVVRPLKRCFCTAKLFQRQSKQYTVGRVTLFKTMTPFILQDKHCFSVKDFSCISKTNVTENTDEIDSIISKENETTMADVDDVKSFIYTNKHEEPQYLQSKTETLLPYVPIHYEHYESHSLFSSTVAQDKAVKMSEVKTIENKLSKEQNHIKTPKMKVCNPFNRMAPKHIFFKKCNQTKIGNYNMQEYATEKLFKNKLKKSESERKPQKLSYQTRESKSMKIHKPHASTTYIFAKETGTVKYSPLQSGDACWNKSRHSNDGLNNTHVIQSKPSKKEVKSIFYYLRKFIKTKFKNDFADMEIRGKGLKLNFVDGDIKNSIVSVSCAIKKATGDATRYDTYCLNGKIICNKKYRAKRKGHVSNNYLSGIKLKIKGKCPEPRIAMFFNKAGYLKMENS